MSRVSVIVGLVIVNVVVFHASVSAAEDWQPKKAPVMTRWAKDVSPEKVHTEYPRPHLVREHWQNLNGLWEYAIRPQDEVQPTQWDGQILVPFPVESALSGVMKFVGPENRLWYRRTFTLPQQDGKTSPAWTDKKILLHFGAVDWQTTVWVNGKPTMPTDPIGPTAETHIGGYAPFSCDITRLLQADKPNEIVVSVYDPSDAGFQPRGKQVRKPHGIWYTPTTGIWQTVWLEPVPLNEIQSLSISTDIDAKTVSVYARMLTTRTTIRVTVSLNGKPVSSAGGIYQKPVIVSIPEPQLWSPDNPVLYDVEVRADYGNSGDPPIDVVKSYFGMRKISLGQDQQGFLRLMLNNKPLFQFGPLDQGFWPDGLYTAPTDEALKYDLEMTKKLGFNMVRKHVKVEPARWYHHCDKLGLLVWQDLPSGDAEAKWDPFGKFDGTEMTRSKESSKNLDREWGSIINSLRNFTSIVMWVPFNEGWGQANTVAVTNFTKGFDRNRLVNCASGGNDFPVGDIYDIHRYPGPFLPRLYPDRATVLGEFGGLGLPLEGHTWQGKDNWGYRSFTTKEDLQAAYLGMLGTLRPMIAQGLSAAVYTQTTDVEVEVNGLMTYDRAVLKMDGDVIGKAARKLYRPPPKVTVLVPTSEQAAQMWRFTTEKPVDGWQKPAFDDSSWKSGPGGFGEPTTPGSAVKTNWKTNDIWLRREVEVKPFSAIHELALRIHHDEDTEVFLNGVLIAKTTGYTTQYVEVPLDQKAVELLKEGKNTLAVHCKQTGGGQYIDVGLVDVEEVAK